MFRELLIYISAFIGLFAVIFYSMGFFSKRKEHVKPLEEGELPSVSIIIPAYNEESGIEDTIKSALSLDYPRDKLEIIVVDDGSKDKTYERAKKMKSTIVKVFTKPNGGKGTALNFGIKKAKGKIILTMDADTIAEPNALRNMVRYFQRPEVMCVTPAMAIKKPKGIWQRIQQIEYFLGIYLRKSFASMNAIHITPGAFSTYRKSFFDKYGGYDEKNITEDLEIALRIQHHHYVIENALDAVIYTESPKKFQALLNQRKRWYYGLVTNLWRYKSLFSKKYGDMGLIVLPVAIITIFISIILTVYVFFKSLIDIKNQIILFSTINFNFSDIFSLNNFILERTLYTILSNPIFVISILFILILAGYMVFAKSKIKKDSEIKLSFPLFLILYSILFAFWWIVSIFYVLVVRKISWGKK